MLEDYYRNPIMESWTYVSMGMKALQGHNPVIYEKIKRKQQALLPEMNERIDYIYQVCSHLGLRNREEIKFYLEQYLEKFPLALGKFVGWDDPNFIFLYLVTRIVKPKVVVETGCSVGFSTSFMALAIRENNNGCNFYTIDPNPVYEWGNCSFVKESSIRRQKINWTMETARSLCMVPRDLRELIILKQGYARDILPEIVNEGNPVDIFFHDSDHAYKSVMWECSTMLDVIRPGGYIFVHDLNCVPMFKKMILAQQNGIVAGNNMGIFKKEAGSSTFIDKRYVSPADNSRLNDHEYNLKKIILESSPKTIVFESWVSCDLNCAHCVKRSQNSSFDLFNLTDKLLPDNAEYFYRAEKIIFKGCGNFFQSISFTSLVNLITCLQCAFDETDKIFYTNGLDLTPQICNLLLRSVPLSGDNIINIILPAASPALYKDITGSSNEAFYKVIGQIRYLLELASKERKEGRLGENFKVNLVFEATPLNIEDLPSFIRLASKLGINKVICRVPTQKHHSCFLKPNVTSRILDEAEKVAAHLKMETELPLKIKSKSYPDNGICLDPWNQMTLSSRGPIIPCDAHKEANGSLEDKSFSEIWNGHYYQNLRRGQIAILQGDNFDGATDRIS